MKPMTKTGLILGGLVAVHVVLYVCSCAWTSLRGVLSAAVQSVLPTQGVLLGFWIAMGSRWAIPWRACLVMVAVAVAFADERLVPGSAAEYTIVLLWETWFAALALLALRFAGLRMVQAGVEGTASAPFQFSLRDMFHWTTATAVFIASVKCSGFRRYLTRMPPIALLIFAGIALLGLLGMWLVFRKWRLARRFLGGLAVIIVATVPFAMATEGATNLPEVVIIPVIAFVLSAYAAWLIASFLVIRWAGYRLEWQWRFGSRRAVPTAEETTAIDWIDNMIANKTPPHGWVHDMTPEALGQIPPAAIPALADLLGNKDYGVRHAAAKAFGKIGPDAKAAIRALTELLKDKREDVPYYAILALGSIGPDAETAVPALTELLKEECVRHAAAESLGKIGPAAKAAIPGLTELLKDKDESVRRVAAEALGRIGPAAIPLVSDLLDDEDHDTRGAAIQALGQIGAAAVPTLMGLLKNEDDRLDAAEALGNVGPRARMAIPSLVELIKGQNVPGRKRVADAIKKIETGKDREGATPK